MSQDDSYTVILLEEIRDQNKAVLESVGQTQDKIATLTTQESLDALDAKVTTIEKALTATNVDIADLDRRVTTLEQAT